MKTKQLIFIAFFILNILSILFLFIENITKTDNNILTNKKHWLSANGIILIILAMITLSWCDGWIETRNKRIMEKQRTQPTPIIMKEEERNYLQP